MRTKIFYIIGLLAICVSCSSSPSREPASEGLANPNNPAEGDTDFSSRNRTRKGGKQEQSWGGGGCSASTAASRILSIGARENRSGHGCVGAVQRAYASCSSASAIHSGAKGIASMAAHGWHCTRTTDKHAAHYAPEGAVIAEANYVEIRVGNCFYSDFHWTKGGCRPETEARHWKRPMFGWCTPP